jgi:hypothetical protein
LPRCCRGASGARQFPGQTAARLGGW